MTGINRSANLLGTLALAVSDRTADAIGAETGQSGTAAAALSALHHFLDRPTIDLLRQVLGLTHSGTVRLVDRLTEVGYVTRSRGADGRSTAIELTSAGRAAAVRVGDARAAVLEGALAALDPADRATFERLAGEMLAGFVRGRGATRWLCRLCDTGGCGRDEGRCPVANTAAANLAAPPP